MLSIYGNNLPEMGSGLTMGILFLNCLRLKRIFSVSWRYEENNPSEGNNQALFFLKFDIVHFWGVSDWRHFCIFVTSLINIAEIKVKMKKKHSSLTGKSNTARNLTQDILIISSWFSKFWSQYWIPGWWGLSCVLWINNYSNALKIEL